MENGLFREKGYKIKAFSLDREFRIRRTNVILLLGKTESEHLISPAIARIRWILKDSNGNERDYSIIKFNGNGVVKQDSNMLTK